MEATHSPIKITKGEMEFEVSPLNVIKPTGLSDKPDMLFEINFKNKNKKDKFLFSQVKFFKQQNSYGINLGGYNDVTQEVNEMLKLPKNRELTILIDNPTYQKMKSIYDEELDKYNKQREKGKAGAMETLREKFNKAKEIKIRYFTNSSGHGDVLLALPGEKLSADERDYLNNAEEFNEIKDFIIRNVMKDKGFQLIEKNNGDYNIDQEYIADKDWVLKRAKEYSEEKMKALKRKYQEARKTWLNEIEKGKTWLNEIEKGKIQILNKKDEIKRIQKDLDRYAKLLKLTQEEYIAMQDELDFTYIEFMDALNEQGEDSPVGYKYHQAIQKIYDKYLDKK